MIRFDKSEFNTPIYINPQEITPIDRYFFLYPNLKLIDDDVKAEDLPIIEFYNKRGKNWRGGISAIDRAHKIVETYLDIKKNGYNQSDGHTLIRVTIEDGGIVRCYDGHNRLCMLHHLGVTKPILVQARLSREIEGLINIKNSHGEKGFYQPIPHPIFYDSNQSRLGHAERLKYLTLCLRADQFDSILDIGCYTGYYSIMLAKQFNCKVTGVERTEDCHRISVGLQDWWRRHYGAVEFLLGDFRNHRLDKHDVTVCLSVLHHYLKESEETVIDFVNRIEEVTRKLVIIEVAGDVPQMKKVKPPPTAEVWRNILKQTNFHKVRLLDGSPGTRHFFELRCK